jgi:hypothetical protein
MTLQVPRSWRPSAPHRRQRFACLPRTSNRHRAFNPRFVCEDSAFASRLKSCENLEAGVSDERRRRLRLSKSGSKVLFASQLKNRDYHPAKSVLALSAACGIFIAFALPGIAHARNIMTREILPSQADPSITRFNEPSVIVFDEETPADSPLVVFMPDFRSGSVWGLRSA